MGNRNRSPELATKRPCLSGCHRKRLSVPAERENAMKGAKLGEPLQSLAVWASAYTEGPEGSRIYAVSSGSPCMLHIIDPLAGKSLIRLPMPGSDHCWGVVAAPSGIYMGGSGILYRYTPERGVEDLGVIIPGETYTWRLTADADGMIYGGIYPGGKVFGYDPGRDTFRDYGPIVPGEQYARSMAALGGKLYVGAGTRTPHLVVLDTATGKKREIALPPGCENDQLVYDVDISRGKLFARLTPSNRLLIYDMASGEWEGSLEGCSGLSVSQPDALGRVYFVKDDRLHSYDAATGELRATALPMPEPAGDYGWLRGHPLNPKGDCLIGVYRSGGYWVYDPASDTHETYDLELAGQPVMLQSMTQGPEGAIYVGGYFAGGLGRYGNAEPSLASWRGVGQIEGMIAGNGLLYLGVYPKANIMAYDPARAWRPGDNPKLLFSLQVEEQDRPFVFAWAAGRLAIGTVPSYGRHGGALTLYDPVTGKREVQRHLLPDQSIVSLVSRDAVLYAGGSVWGGLGIAPVAEEAELLCWDAAAGATRWRRTPIAGAKAISALVCDDRGVLWGLAGGLLFAVNSQDGQLLHTVEIEARDWSKAAHFWRGGEELICRAGGLYGVSGGVLFHYNMEEAQLTLLDRGVKLLAAGGEGGLYTAKGTELYRYEASRGEQCGERVELG
ncbi:WD40 repeat domain-containing protein [Paenibacillus sp. 1P07SE]|uniref:WD40 repeat domain-containing protein n=1 Tax=Paenibacillus sp. 1P07SE TaxID=3132209 RepID=UPI0039A4FB7E